MDSYFHTAEAQGGGTEEEEQELNRATETAKCLLLFSRAISRAEAAAALPLRGGYECKTCNRRFPSFQALGGHRASHKRVRFADDDGDQEQQSQKHLKGGGVGGGGRKTGGHECAICGLEFAIGQALGGHMRRHRNSIHELTLGAPTPLPNKKADAKKTHFFDLNQPPLEDFSTFILA